MKISAIPQIYRHLARWREILAVLSKYGLADWISRWDLEFAKEFLKDRLGDPIARHSAEMRIRLALNELGPTFIKLGQVLSTRPDLVGVRLAEELQQLQNQTMADPPAMARATIERELGAPIEELFLRFEEAPLASASIGQVHRGQLLDGDEVVVKVRHAQIEHKISVDLEILSGVAAWAEEIPEFKLYRPTATVAEFQRTLLRELDFEREAQAMQQFADELADMTEVCIPRVYPEQTTSRVLTMQFLEGIPLTDTAGLRQANVDLSEIARVGANLYLRMIFLLGSYHADPHPGNLMILEDHRLGLLDYGMIGRVDDQLREDLEDMLIAIGQQDAARLTSIIMRMGSVPAGLDEASLQLDVGEFVQQYANMPFEKIDVSAALREILEMIRRYHIVMPARVSMLIKVFIMLEGTSHLLDPNFRLIDVIEPYQRKLMLRRMSPTRRLKKMRRFAGDVERLFEMLPRGLTDMFTQLRAGKFEVHLEHRSLEPSVNRLVYGMLTSALFLGSTLLLSRKLPPVITLPWFEEFSLLGALGCATSIFLGLRLLRAIGKSGRLG
ncbi:MAG: AarF/ABC1/UbiB kinase family protein [Planctomycetes bacterium]|nr:AarF/ABC1/UbiB kinase family protein [Planctomycetota bacterium]